MATSPKAPAVDCVLDAKAMVGECALWNERDRRLYWVDIQKPTLNRFDPSTGVNEVCTLDQAIGCFGFREHGGFVGAFADDGFCTFDFDAPALIPLANPEPDNPEYRFNDGRTDPYGAFWSGTIKHKHGPGDRGGTIYQLRAGEPARPMLQGVGATNGIAFDAGRRRCYIADSVLDTVWCFDHDPDTGDISNQRIFVTTGDQPGLPDGACVDADGCYWSANVRGWRVIRYTPDGRIDRVIPMPVQRPTMCCFGGMDLDILFVTSIGPAARNTEVETEPGQPHAGGIFACRPGVQGLAEPFFNG
jgi:sugar lactone lactonase YvrE